MAPAMDMASPNGDGSIVCRGDAIGSNRLTPSASAPTIGTRKGVSIMIDPTAPMRDGTDDTDCLLLPSSSAPSSPCGVQNPGGKSAWGSRPGSRQESRPGSRQSAGPMGSRYSTCSIASSMRQQSTSGRFSHEELLCFKRVPTPSSSCDNKRDGYFEPGASGSLRAKLASENWNTLPVLKGKFYSHPPRLSDSFSHLSTDKAHKHKAHRKQTLLHNQRAENLPNEALTAALLDEIYPKTPTSVQQRERGESMFVGFEMSPCGGDASPSALSVSGDSTRKSYQKQRTTAGGQTTTNKRLSASDFVKAQETTKVEFCMPEPSPTTTTHAQALTIKASLAGPDTQFNNSAALNSTGGTTSTPASREALAAAARLSTMLEFRKQIFVNYHTIKEAFDSFDREFPGNREMTKKEWRRVLVKLGFEATVDERDAIFDQLDINNNGHVSMMEFHIAIEAAAPIRTIEDLRRRWLASGYTSMAQVFAQMDDGSHDRRLALREFGELLSKVHVIDHNEHAAVFNAIADQNDTSRNCKVSVGELAAALATVSPAPYLEEIRQRLLKRYAGNAEKAFFDIDQDRSGIVSKGEFKARTCFRMGLTEMEALKMFETIDFDHNGSMSMSEFLTALSMSEPSLFHEDLRKKVRQRFRSMRTAFEYAKDDFANADLLQNPKLQFPRFENLLCEMDLKTEELKTLFDLIDANKDGALTINEFLHGIRHFAPSCVLEDLRLQCLQRHDYVGDAFLGVDRLQPLNLATFRSSLEMQRLVDGVDVESVFSLLDVRNEGLVTLGKLTAALQAGGPGNHVRQGDQERDHAATQEVKGVMAVHHKFAWDLKGQVRLSLQAAEEAVGRSKTSDGSTMRGGESQDISQASAGGAPASPGGFRQVTNHHHKKRRTVDGASITMAAVQAMAMSPKSGKAAAQASGGGNPATPGQGKKQEAAVGISASDAGEGEDEVTTDQVVAPRIRAAPQEELAKYMAKLDPSRIQEHKKIMQDPIAGTQQSWGRLWQYLHKSPDAKERLEVEKELLQYYQKATKTVSHDVPLLERSHSRHALHKSIGRAHRK